MSEQRRHARPTFLQRAVRSRRRRGRHRQRWNWSRWDRYPAALGTGWWVGCVLAVSTASGASVHVLTNIEDRSNPGPLPPTPVIRRVPVPGPTVTVTVPAQEPPQESPSHLVAPKTPAAAVVPDPTSEPTLLPIEPIDVVPTDLPIDLPTTPCPTDDATTEDQADDLPLPAAPKLPDILGGDDGR